MRARRRVALGSALVFFGTLAVAALVVGAIVVITKPFVKTKRH